MNRTPIIIVIVIVVIALCCCCSIGALLWTLGIWQNANEPYRYQGNASITMPLGPVQEVQPAYLATIDP